MIKSFVAFAATAITFAVLGAIASPYLPSGVALRRSPQPETGESPVQATPMEPRRSDDAATLLRASLEPAVEVEPASADVSPRRQAVHAWAGYNPLAENAAKSRSKLIDYHEKKLESAELTANGRANHLYTMARLSIFTIEDFERSSNFDEDASVKESLRAGNWTCRNSGALYSIPAGTYAVADRLAHGSTHREQVRRSDIEHLVSRARELLEPYASE